MGYTISFTQRCTDYDLQRTGWQRRSGRQTRRRREGRLYPGYRSKAGIADGIYYWTLNGDWLDG
ncbi:MAG: hypothetical protein V8R52_14095 [Coprobacter fastidiosus]